MPDETQTTTDTNAPATPAATTAPVTAPAASVNFTPEQQEQVNAIVAKRLAEDRARRNPPPAAPAAAAPAPQPTQVALPDDGEPHMTPKQMRDALNELNLRSRFDKQALKRGVDDARAEDLFALFKMQKPANDTVWFDEKAALWGFDKGQSAAPTAPTAATAAPNVAVPPAGPPISDKGSPAPGGVTNWEREFAENPVGMSQAARALMDAKYGVEKARRMRVEAATERQGHIRVTVK